MNTYRNLKTLSIAALVSFSPLAISTAEADILTNDQTIWSPPCTWCDLDKTSSQNGSITPNQGWLIYSNGQGFYFNDVKLTTTGNQADGFISKHSNSLFIARNFEANVSGSSADGINLGNDNEQPSQTFSNVFVVREETKINAVNGTGVRANNAKNAGSETVIILEGKVTLNITGTSATDHSETYGYGVYAGNRKLDTACGYSNPCNKPGSSYVFIGEDAKITTNASNGHGVYANRGGMIQLGDGVTVTTGGSNANALYALTDGQQSSILGGTHAGSVRPGYIYLSGGAKLQGSDANAVVIHARGEGSIIANLEIDVPVITDDHVKGSVIGIDKTATRETGGVFDMVGGIQASEGGRVNLNLRTDAEHASSFVGYTVLDGNTASTINLSIDGSISEDQRSTWTMTRDSSLTSLTLTNGAVLDASASGANFGGTPQNLTLTGDVYNTSGVIDLVGGKDPDEQASLVEFTIDGNYVGGDYDAVTNPSGSKGTLKVNKLWYHPNESYTDKLHITGSATGYTQVVTIDGIITGDISAHDQERFSAPVIVVDNHDMTTNAFYGFADTEGAGQATLVHKDDNNYHWYLARSNPTDPTVPVNPTSPRVPGYTMMPTLNMEMGYAAIATLHERVSEHQARSWEKGGVYPMTDGSATQGWGRMIGGQLSLDGKNRFGADLTIAGAQFGYDLDIDYDEANSLRRHTGVMFTLLHGWSSFDDRRSVFFDQSRGDYRSGKKDTGDGSNFMVGVGAYNTYYMDDGSYLDLVGNLTYQRNKYESTRANGGNVDTHNHAYGAALSIEAGKPFEINENWFIEPQAQLIYQYQRYSNFSDAVLRDFDQGLTIEQKDNHGLRGRAGFRAVYHNATEDGKANTLYMTANVVHDFIDPSDVKVGIDTVSEDFRSPWAQFGLGLQLPTSEAAYVYADTRIDHSLSSKDDGQRMAYRATVGFKYQW